VVLTWILVGAQDIARAQDFGFSKRSGADDADD